ncbi:MAG: FAD-dependent oxidoreductase [Castellaniella sp.]
MLDVAVIGAGIVGLSTATYLRREGHAVTLIDPLSAGGGASYGNAGMISVDSTVPMAMPGMLKNVPRWLRDPTGPLFVDPKYFPKAMPWLLKWARAGRMANVRAASLGLKQLHESALDHYRELLGPADFNDLIRVTGQIHIWDSEQLSVSERVAATLRSEQGIEVQSLTRDELRERVPELTPTVKRALLFPRNGNAVNPLRLMRTLAERLREDGGKLIQERVQRIFPRDGTFRVMTNLNEYGFDRVVVAAGAWSKTLLAPMGVSLPLETERGYHVQINDPGIEISIPILHKGRGFSTSPMEMGLRFAGTVEIAGLDAPPNEQRGQALLSHARALYPNLRTDNYKLWLGFRPSFPDSLPVIDEVAAHPGLYMAFGHGHTGLTGGPSTGKLMAQLVSGTRPYLDMTPYRLSRF